MKTAIDTGKSLFHPEQNLEGAGGFVTPMAESSSSSMAAAPARGVLAPCLRRKGCGDALFNGMLAQCQRNGGTRPRTAQRVRLNAQKRDWRGLQSVTTSTQTVEAVLEAPGPGRRAIGRVGSLKIRYDAKSQRRKWQPARFGKRWG